MDAVAQLGGVRTPGPDVPRAVVPLSRIEPAILSVGEPLPRLKELHAAGRYVEAADLAAGRQRCTWSRQGLQLAALVYERLLQPADAIDIWLEYGSTRKSPAAPSGSRATSAGSEMRRWRCA